MATTRIPDKTLVRAYLRTELLIMRAKQERRIAEEKQASTYLFPIEIIDAELERRDAIEERLMHSPELRHS